MAKRNIFILIVSLFSFLSVCYTQNSLEDINVILKNNFENNTLGTYSYSEWSMDWLNPNWCSRQNMLQIAQKTDDATNPSKVLLVTYPKGSLGPEEGGTQWYTHLPSKYEEIYVSYDVLFMPGFEFQHGGKIPSVMGGDPESTKPSGYDGFTGGMMFKGDIPAFYIYYPDANIPEYGVTFLWGRNYAADFFSPSVVKLNYTKGNDSKFIPGVWHNITYRMVLNTVKSGGGGNYDGIMEAYFDGVLVTQLSNILFRHTKDIAIDVFRLVTFFGGNTDEWRNPYEEWVKMDNVLLYTFKENMNVPRGNVLSPTNRVINYWRHFGSTIVDPVPDPDPDPIPDPVPVETNTAPTIQNQEFLIKENNFTGNFVGKIVAYDTDPGQILSYTIVGGNQSGVFQLDSKTGDLTTTITNLFNFDLTEYNLVVKVTDNGTNVLSSSASINISFIAGTSVVHIDPNSQADPNEDGTISHPFNSWRDVAWREGNTYLQKSGTTANESNIVIGANNVTLDSYGDGELPVIISETSGYMISGSEKSNVTIKNLHFKAAKALSCIYFDGSTSTNINIEHCTLEGNYNSFRAIDCKSVFFKYNTMTSDNVSIYSTATQNDIFYNIFKNNSNSIHIVGSTTKANIFNNVFVNNLSAVSAWNSNMTLYNNIFYMPDKLQKAIEYNSDKLVSDNNIFYPEQDGFIEIAGKLYNSLDEIHQKTNLDAHSLNEDPLFVDMENDNFALETYSPAINAGISLNLGHDFLGQDVPIAGIPDIGVVEFTGKIPGKKGTLDPKLMLYPNPSTGYVNVEIDLANTNFEPLPGALIDGNNSGEIRLMDLNGKMILNKAIEGTGTIIRENFDLTGISNGIYLIVLKTGDNIIKEKLVINK